MQNGLNGGVGTTVRRPGRLSVRMARHPECSREEFSKGRELIVFDVVSVQLDEDLPKVVLLQGPRPRLPFPPTCQK
jgi:hypothetical protein